MIVVFVFVWAVVGKMARLIARVAHVLIVIVIVIVIIVIVTFNLIIVVCRGIFPFRAVVGKVSLFIADKAGKLLLVVWISNLLFPIFFFTLGGEMTGFFADIANDSALEGTVVMIIVLVISLSALVLLPIVLCPQLSTLLSYGLCWFIFVGTFWGDVARLSTPIAD
jgi:hypothetical protein